MGDAVGVGEVGFVDCVGVVFIGLAVESWVVSKVWSGVFRCSASSKNRTLVDQTSSRRFWLVVL